jgi:hypothetical protein
VEKRLGGWKAVQSEFFEDTVSVASRGGTAWRAKLVAGTATAVWKLAACAGILYLSQSDIVSPGTVLFCTLQGICSEVLRDVGARKLVARMAK